MPQCSESGGRHARSPRLSRISRPMPPAAALPQAAKASRRGRLHERIDPRSTEMPYKAFGSSARRGTTAHAPSPRPPIPVRRLVPRGQDLSVAASACRISFSCFGTVPRRKSSTAPFAALSGIIQHPAWTPRPDTPSASAGGASNSTPCFASRARIDRHRSRGSASASKTNPSTTVGTR